MIKKLILTLVAFVSITSMVQANSYNSYNLFNGLNCNNNSYGCSLNFGAGQQVTDCTFTFTSCNTSYHGNYLSCDLNGVGITCKLGSCQGSTSTWTCTLDQTQLGCLNQCFSSGKCDFNVNCYGNWKIGNCTCKYTCNPTPRTSRCAGHCVHRDVAGRCHRGRRNAPPPSDDGQAGPGEEISFKFPTT